MAVEIADILSSRAKFKVLQVLSAHASFLKLRMIAGLTELPVRSVQLALESLVKTKIIREKFIDHYHLFQFSSQHPFAEALKEFFSNISKIEIQSRSAHYLAAPSRALTFASSSKELFSKVTK